MVKILPRIADNSENEWDYTASVISIQLGMRREGCGTPEEVRACSSDWERQRTEGSGPLAKETSSTSFQFFPENKTKQNHLKAVKEMTRAVCGLGKKKITCCCSVAQSHQTLCDRMDRSTSAFPVHHHLPELAQTHVHSVSDAVQPS